MSDFNTNKNAFMSSIHTIKSDIHSFQILGIGKGAKNEKQQKITLLNIISNTIDNIETNDFGIRVLILRIRK